jgi:hypothetical protein
MQQSAETQWLELVHNLGKDFIGRAAEHDRDDTFVSQNYAELKKHHFFSALIPPELGGGGVSHAQMCDILRTMAQYCGSTALAFSMHQHLLAANIWDFTAVLGLSAYSATCRPPSIIPCKKRINFCFRANLFCEKISRHLTSKCVALLELH